MNIVGAGVVFIIAWWLVFFAVLPIGVQGQFEKGEVTDGTEPAAPVNHMVPKKALWATIGAAILTAILAVSISLLVP